MLIKRLLQASIVVLIISLMAIVMQPVDAQLEAQNSVKPPSISTTSNEPTSIQGSNGTTVKLPVSYNEKNTYPALVLLPFTGGMPTDYFGGSFAEAYGERTTPENSFIVILLNVEGKQSDWDPPENFAPTIKRYEDLVKSNLDVLVRKYKIDASRIVIGGSSLGGDLSWALSLKNPDRFRGTIVINSQSNYRGNSDNDRSKIFQQLADNKSRFFMIASEVDEKQRLPDMRRAVEELAQYGVIHKFAIVPGTDYESSAIRTEMLMQGVDYVMSDDCKVAYLEREKIESLEKIGLPTFVNICK